MLNKYNKHPIQGITQSWLTIGLVCKPTKTSKQIDW